MTEVPGNATRYRFGPFELDPGEGTLSRKGIRVRLQDLPYRLLLMLVERPGEIVTREEVRQHLWPENTFVEFDNSLGVAIRKVRESLNDNAEAPNYVATIPRRGYRFVAPVTVEGRRPAENGQPRRLRLLRVSRHIHKNSQVLRTGVIGRRPPWCWCWGLAPSPFVFTASRRTSFPGRIPAWWLRYVCAGRWRCLDSAICPAMRKTIGFRRCSRKCWTQSWAPAAICAWFREKI